MIGRMFLLISLALIVGCTTVPDPQAFVVSALPRPVGPETAKSNPSYAYAHQYTINDARTALWYQRNLPYEMAGFFFTAHKLLSFNIHDEQDDGFFLDYDDYFVNWEDPVLRVKVLSIESRDQNRRRLRKVEERRALERELLAEKREKAQKFTELEAEDISVLPDEEVNDTLQQLFP